MLCRQYCKTLIFRCILISRFCCFPVHRWNSYSPRFFDVALTRPTSSFADATSACFSIVFFSLSWSGRPKTLSLSASDSFSTMALYKSIYLLTFSTSKDCLHLQWGFWYSMQMRFCWWAYFKFAGIKIHGYLIPRFYLIREIREN